MEKRVLAWFEPINNIKHYYLIDQIEHIGISRNLKDGKVSLLVRVDSSGLSYGEYVRPQNILTKFVSEEEANEIEKAIVKLMMGEIKYLEIF